jgi:hypothetical protein
MPRHRSQIVIAVVALSAVVTAAWAAAWGYASLQARAADEAMARWESSHAVGSEAELDWVERRLRRATRIDPFDADFAAALGRAYDWQASTQPPYTRDARRNRGKAIDWYRKAVTLRPSWGFAWIHLAQAKVADQEFDAEAIAALDNAMRFGPWEAGTQRRALRLGVLLWDRLPGRVRKRVGELLVNAVQVQSREVIDLLVPLGWGERIRPLLHRPADIHYFESVAGPR